MIKLESIEEASRRRNIGSDGNGNNNSSRDDFPPGVARSSSSSSSSVSGRRKGRGRSGRTRGSNASPTTLPSSDSHSSSLGDIKEEEGCTISIINEESIRGTSSSSPDAPDGAAAVGNAACHPLGGTSGKNIGSAVLLHESPDGKLGQEKKAAEQSTEQLDEVNDEVNDELGVDDEGQVISDAGPILDEGSTKTSHSTKLESRENEVAGINTINDTHRQDQNQDGNDNKPSEQDEDRIQFFILLLCPTSRIFELIEIAASDAPHNESTLSDVLCLIPEKCTDERLLQKEYWGLVRPSDRANFVHLHAKVFDTADDDGGSKATEGDDDNDDDNDRHHREKQDAIQGGDVLVAILKDYTGFEMSDISKPIVRDASFRNMIRRRSKKMVRGGKKRNSWQSDDGSMRSSRSVQSSRSGRKGQRNSATTKQAALPEIDCGLSAEIDSNNNQDGTSPGTTPKKANLAANVNDGKENNRYSSLCKKLENLSQKLTNVDDEILADDVSVEGSKLSNSLQEETVSPQEDPAAHNITHTTVEEAGLHARQPSFKMAPEMLADEVAAKIEDIFAGHDVELVAVDAEDEHEHEHDSDEDTFATAKSRRSTKSMRSSRSSKQSKPQISIEDENENIMPVLEITTTKKKKKRKPRKNRPPSKFAFEEDDMMLQIEAMARQADAVFGSRKAIANGSVGVAGTTIIDPMMEGAAAAEPNYHVIDENTETTHAAQNDVNDEGTASSDAKKALRTSVSFEGVSSSEGCNVDESLVPSNSTGSKQSALSRYFLNTSASMVSTMVKGPNGAVNEVHMLQYLGVPIVCMAANVMQQQQGGTSQGQQDFFSSRRKRNSFGADVLQSAMFLAFMVNGQRYLAKVTKK